jgi:hypothetical protein
LRHGRQCQAEQAGGDKHATLQCETTIHYLPFKDASGTPQPPRTSIFPSRSFQRCTPGKAIRSRS